MHGLYDSGYTFNDIFTAKVNKTSNAKVYSGISHSEMLPYADEFIEVGFSLLDRLTFTFNDLELSLKGQPDDFDRVTETDGTVLYNRDYLGYKES